MRKPTVNSLMTGLDNLCFEITLAEYGEKCIICDLIGKEPHSPLQPMHVYTRGIKFLRWHPWNIVPGCSNHHGYGVHNNKTLTEDLLKAIYALMCPEKWQFIHENQNTFFDVSVDILEKKRIELEAYRENNP